MNGRPMSEKKEHWFNLANQTSLKVSEIFGNQQAAVLLAGAVFALHQDVKKALKVDLFAPDASSPDTGNRLSLAIEQLYGIMDANQGYYESPPADAKKSAVILAHMRASP